MSLLFASQDGKTLDDILEDIGDAVCITDRNMVFMGANRAFANFYGFPNAEDVLGKSAFDVYPHFKRSIFYQACQNTIETGKETSRIGYSNNLKTWLVSRVYPLAEDRYAMVVHSVNDESSKLGYVHQVDPLTSLPNRWALEADVEVLSGLGTPLSLALVDISHFKRFNESVGFEAGNRALMEVAARLKGALASRERAYRIGDDQFVVMCTDAAGEFQHRIQNFMELLSEPLTLADQSYVLRFNVGVSCLDRSEASSDALRRAEIALFHAKSSRVGLSVYVKEMETSAYDPALVKQIRDAISKDQLVLFYQPQVDLSDGKVSGAEVLVRWQHPTRGLVSPVDFLPFAEETGLIQEIDYAVARKAFERVVEMEKGGLTLPLSVNLSAQSICDTATVKLFASLLQKHGVDPSMIGVEITETSLMRDVGTSQQVLEALREMGLKISIDDFGSGYSSMAYLLRYPSQFLKIDRGFTSNLITSTSHQVMVRNIISLAHGLGMAVVAEGVETLEECEMLREFDCDLVQGYYFTMPIEEDAFCSWVKEKGVSSFNSGLH